MHPLRLITNGILFFCEYCGAQITDAKMQEAENESRRVELKYEYKRKMAENESRRMELEHIERMAESKTEFFSELLYQHEWIAVLSKKLAMFGTWLGTVILLKYLMTTSGFFSALFWTILWIIDLIVCGPIVLIKLIRKWD